VSRGDEHRRRIEEALAPALRLARDLPPWNASHVLLTIARLLLGYRQVALAHRLLDGALAAHADDERTRLREAPSGSDFWWRAAHVLAEAGRAPDAIRMALLLPSPGKAAGGSDSDTALASIARTLAWRGDIAAARRVLRHLRTPLARLDTLWGIADAYARAGKATKAAATIRAMRGSRLAARHKRAAWQTVADWLAFRGDATAALAAAREIRGDDERACLLASVAEWAAAAQPLLLPDIPVAIARRARRAPPDVYLAAAMAMTQRRARRGHNGALLRVGLAAARIGRLDLARDVLARLAATMDTRHLAELRCHIAAAAARAGRIEEARSLARRLTQRERAAVLSAMAASEAAARNESSALAIAAEIAIPELRVDAMLDIARAASAQGRSADARRQLRTLSQFAIAERRHVPSALIEAIACEQARLGDTTGAATTLTARETDVQPPSFASAALACAETGRYRTALLFARHMRSADDQATLTAEIGLIRHARHCPRCARGLPR